MQLCYVKYCVTWRLGSRGTESSWSRQFLFGLFVVQKSQTSWKHILLYRKISYTSLYSNDYHTKTSLYWKMILRSIINKSALRAPVQQQQQQHPTVRNIQRRCCEFFDHLAYHKPLTESSRQNSSVLCVDANESRNWRVNHTKHIVPLS
jgi:hypothetical protein